MLSRISKTTLPALLPVSARSLTVSAIRYEEDVQIPRQRSDNFYRQPKQDKTREDSSRSKMSRPAPHVRTVHRTSPPPHLLTLADLSPAQINNLLKSSIAFKLMCKTISPNSTTKSLTGRTVALLFNKRSTRTRVASETAVKILGGHSMFLGSADVQLGVNESLRDTSTVVGSMVDGFMARVAAHDEVVELAKYSQVPVINALSDLYHPTQILADLLTLYEAYAPKSLSVDDIPNFTMSNRPHRTVKDWVRNNVDPLATLQGKKVAWIGDTNNIVNDMMVSMPRLGMTLAVASPKGYDKVDERVWKRVVEAGTESSITLTNSPAEALKDADIVVTDTWISMGQETEKESRLEAFKGYQITNDMVDSAGAKPDWKFLHCLPRKPEEVDDEVFYGPRSLVFPEAENRKWTTMATFDAMIGYWKSS